MAEIIAIVIVVILLFLFAQSVEKHSSQSKQVAFTATKHIPGFLRVSRGIGPWFELDDLYRTIRVDLKCTRCDMDRIFACNTSGETEFVDMHYAKGKITILHGDHVLFDGEPLNLMSYPEEAYFVKMGQPGPSPPEGTYAYKLYADYMRHKENGTLQQWFQSENSDSS